MRALVFLLIVTAAGSCGQHNPAPQSSPLNIIVVVADDLGYTDLGAFGGEIRTPNLDQLAMSGIRLTNFHTAASCAPTRAMLLTGTDNHLVGMGSQGGLITPAQSKLRGYGNALLPEFPTIAELLKDQGYRTYATAKWHVGSTAEALPGARGFDRSFVLLEGGAGHFDETPLFAHYEASWLEDDQRVSLPVPFYSSDELTDRLIGYIDGDRNSNRPFFAYLGFTAPHWPLQALPEDIERYAGRYDGGWSRLHEQRLEGAKQTGAVPQDAHGVTHEAGMQVWSELSDADQAAQARTMEVYAAMVDRLDQNVGRLLAYLSQTGELANTAIVFLADNGAEAHLMEVRANRDGWVDENFSHSLEAIGTADSYVTLGPSWARATAAPFRASKSKISEGGIRVPAFVSLPAHRVTSTGGQLDNSYHHVMDLLPTFLAATNAQSPRSVTGQSQWARWHGGKAVYAGKTIAAELYGRRMAQRGDWKVLLQEAPYGTGEWQLYNLAEDLGEQQDLSEKHPDLRQELIDAWHQYADDVGVLLPEQPVPY